MKIEHVAFNVPDAASMGAWYEEHLGFKIERRLEESPFTHFISDDSGTVMLELYSNPDVPMPDYAAQNSMMLHVAYVSNDIEADCQRMIAAGATAVGEVQKTPDGDLLAMFKDPWGFAVQFVKRETPMIP